MRTPIFTTLALLASGFYAPSPWAADDDKRILACRTLNPDAKPIIHLVEWGPRTYVKFAHMRFSATYEAEEDREGWYWSNTGEGYYRYGVLVESDGQAWYHDFSDAGADGLSSPLDQFRCIVK